jgi:atypical dual specificity phosphatase
MAAELDEKLVLGLVTVVPVGAEVAVVGSSDELGEWSVLRAIRMQRVSDSTTDALAPWKPSFWRCEVRANPSCRYKFVRRSSAASEWEWEGSGAKDDRVLSSSAGRYAPVAYWKPSGSADVNEYEHTNRYYRVIQERDLLDADQISPQIWVGTCPRSPEHVHTDLKAKGVTAVLNFQTESDVARNSDRLLPTGADVRQLAEVYASVGLVYIWLPTADMCSLGRRLMLPQVMRRTPVPFDAPISVPVVCRLYACVHRQHTY